MVMAHAQLVQCLTLGNGCALYIRLQGSRCAQIVLLSVTGFSLNAKHLRLVLMTGEIMQVFRRNLLCFCIVSTQQINLTYIIRYQRSVNLVILQGHECLQRLIIFLLGVIDIAQIEDRIRSMCLAHVFEQVKPNLCFLHISELQVSGCHLTNRLITFLVCQVIKVTLIVDFNCFFQLSFIEINGSNHGFYPIGMSGIWMTFQIVLQQFDTVFRFQVVFLAHFGIFLVSCHIRRQDLLGRPIQGYGHQCHNYPTFSLSHLLFCLVMFL